MMAITAKLIMLFCPQIRRGKQDQKFLHAPQLKQSQFRWVCVAAAMQHWYYPQWVEYLVVVES
jgi:hypothetical protein